MSNSLKIATGITLISLGIIALMRRKVNGEPTLLTTINYYPEYDMSQNSNLPRGYRNNNPLNIRIGSSAWRGKVTPNTDGTFEQFSDLVYGYRAALVLLRGKAYINGGYNTIEKIITKWAPESDGNYTTNYIANVSRLSGIDKDAVISRNDKDALCKIVYAMSISENGYKDKAGNDIYATYGLPSMNIINLAWSKI